MDGEETKISLKRKSNCKEMPHDSGDDEPIGSLLKLKGKRKSREILVVDNENKVKCAEMAFENEFGGMDETLANFRKKLRGTKKDRGSQVVMEKHSRDNSLKPSLQSISESLKNGLDADIALKMQEKGMVSDGGAPSEDDTITKVKMKTKRKTKRSKIKSDEKIITRDSEFHDVSDFRVSENGAPHAEKEDASELEVEALENSISTLFQQSTIRKSCDSSSLKNVKESQILDEWSKPNSVDGSEAPVVKSPSLKLLKNFVVSDDKLHVSSSQSVTDHMRRLKDNKGDTVEVISENSASISLVDKCHYSLRQCSGKIACVHDGEINYEATGDLLGFSNSLSCFHNNDDRHCGIFNSVEAKNNCLLPQQGHIMMTCDKEDAKDELHTPASNFSNTSIYMPCIDKENCSSFVEETPRFCLQKKMSCKKCKASSWADFKPSYGLLECTCPKNHDYSSGDEGVNGSAHSSIMLDHQERCPEETVFLGDTEAKQSNASVAQRALRNAKKYRHEDMAYEGDIDWEVLMQGQEFLVDHGVVDKTREKIYSSMAVDSENGKAAAVTAGLKARAVSSIEKIMFKEVLKRKGGLQEYLECRNHILSVWNKDTSRVLPLADLGVSDAPLVGEDMRACLIRDIYKFLDQRGYVNFGVPSEKKKVENRINHELKLLIPKFEETSVAPVVDREDADGDLFSGKKLAADGFVNLQAIEPSTPSACEGCPLDDSQKIRCIDPIYQKEKANVECMVPVPSCIDGAPTAHLEPLCCDERIPAVYSIPNDSSATISSSVGSEYRDVHCDLGARKSIIIIGAGPAGLTAAHHLQRQGFHVTVLEARSRIGGRIFTDHSSLSVPVDLGASIITGVEADVATERRPDPSSLICAQLGLELTVLNSDCPLYDIMTGLKVPADLDETLEAEYNSLLDDMVLLVSEKGEQAMKMSLEDGLEHGLKTRRMDCSRQDDTAVEPVKLPETVMASDRIETDDEILNTHDSKTKTLNPLERRVMDWHFANLEYGCAALLRDVSLPNWNQDDLYGGFGGAHCMIKGGYSAVVESLGEGLSIYLDHVVTDISYGINCREISNDLHKKVKVSTSNGKEFSGDAVLVTVPLGCLKAETIKFLPPLPQWKYLSVKRLGFGILNKVVLEFPDVFWDETVDYFGATAEVTDQRGRCFMFWNVKKTVGAPILIALVVGMAAVEGQNVSSSDHVNYAVLVLRKLFGVTRVPDPVASIVTDWGRDPYCYGAYSYVAVGSSGEDYDILGRPVENCLFFAGEATCKEHPDTVGGAMMSGLREAVRIMDIFNTGFDYTSEVEAMEAARINLVIEKSEIKEIMEKLEALEFSGGLCKNSLDGSDLLMRGSMLKDMFFTAKTSAGRLRLAKELLNLPVGFLKTFASTKEELSILNSWILDSLGKDGTQLLRHCVRLLVLVSTDLLAVRLSGIGKTVKEKVCVHTSRDIRAIASQLVSVWVELFRKEKASKGGVKLPRPSSTLDSKSKFSVASGKPPLSTILVAQESKGSSKVSPSTEQFPSNASTKKIMAQNVRMDARIDPKLSMHFSNPQGSIEPTNIMEDNQEIPMSEEEKAAIAAAEAAQAAAITAAKAYASYDAMHNTLPMPPKMLSFHKFVMREQSTHMDESDSRKNWSGAAIGRQDCLSDTDSRNCRVRDWSVDFSVAGVNLENSRMLVDNRSQHSHSLDVSNQLNIREHTGENTALDSGIFTKAWVDSAGSVGIKDYNSIDRWQIQAAAASSGFSHGTMPLTDEEDSNVSSKLHVGNHGSLGNEISVSHGTLNKESKGSQPRVAEGLKQAVVDYVASLLMPLYKARKIDKEGYKAIMKKTATKVVEQTTDSEKIMNVIDFLDFKRKNKIRDFVDKLIERHMTIKSNAKLGTA